MTESPPRVIVLDDDPTGTQTVADVPVVLNPDRAALEQVASRWDGPVWVLTNTRALPLAQAQLTLDRIATNVRAVFGESARLVLRGDSTLRGHVLGEIDTLAGPGSVALFVPAFIELGRVTIDGVHYAITQDGHRVGVAETEYARDPEYSYRTSNLMDWITDRDPTRPALGMPANVLRRAGPHALASLLMSAPDRAVVVPDAETVSDLHAICDAWVEAQQRGRQVVLRCAASLAGVVTGLSARPATLRPVDGPVLVVCASYTSGAAEQLAALAHYDSIACHQIDLSRVLPALSVDPGYTRELAGAVDQSLTRYQVVVVATPRDPHPGSLTFEAGEAIMDAVVATVRQLQAKFAALVTKGGITSARVARDSLRVPVAYVQGQVLPGIPVWNLSFPPGEGIDHVVVPGNVGQPTAIREIANQLIGPSPIARSGGGSHAHNDPASTGQSAGIRRDLRGGEELGSLGR